MNGDVNYMEEINRLDEKNEKFSEKLNLMEIKLERNNVLTENNTEIMKKTAETLDSVRMTMCQLSNQIEQGNKISSDLAKTVEAMGERMYGLEKKVNNQFEEVCEKIKDVDDKSKIDVVDVGKESFKEKMKGYIAFGGIATVVVAFIKLLDKIFLNVN